MTLLELRVKFNTEFGQKHKWPDTYEVDAETYGNVVHELIQRLKSCCSVKLSVGPNGGVLYKDVELILKKN